MAIAANYRKHAEALIRQIEIDLAGSQEPATRAAWWSWLMNAGRPKTLNTPETPGWFKAIRRAANALAKKVKSACMELFKSNRV